eukprot:scaffold7381_cov310-Pinguiococcus_pyrenoidosus.AAC.56
MARTAPANMCAQASFQAGRAASVRCSSMSSLFSACQKMPRDTLARQAFCERGTASSSPSFR